MRKLLLTLGTAALFYNVVAAQSHEEVTVTSLSMDELQASLDQDKAKVYKPKESWFASKKHKRSELLLAGILLGECRGQGEECMNAVGHVSMNRARANLDRRYGKGLAGVIEKRKQFSCLNKNDSNRPVIMKAIAGKLNPESADGKMWEVAKKVSHHLMHKGGIDPTLGSTHYHAKWMRANWINDKGMVQTTAIDGHIFYRFEA